MRVEAGLFGGGEEKRLKKRRNHRPKMWGIRAEKEFGEFVDKYPKSENLSQALLWQAQAQFEQKKHDAVVFAFDAPTGGRGVNGRTSSPVLDRSGTVGGGNYASASATFGKLAREFPASPLRLGSGGE